ncbi:MAG: ArsB/NhaD family transporter [Victivallales bacterium]|nr:ArsB/NhaD family transporter [Victivallales bacterium]
MTASILIFIIVYILIASEKIEKSLAALLGASAVIAFGLISFEDAVKCIDLNVLFLLIGMMTCVNALAETGFFEWIAIYISKKAKGNALMIFSLMLVVTMVFSAFLDNVTTIILLAPVTILITQVLEIPTMPFLIMEALASNIGGTGTLIGDPPNIIIGSKLGLTFNNFLIHSMPGVLIMSIVFITTACLILRKKLHITDDVKQRVINSYPKLAIRSKRKLIITLSVLFLVFAGFFVHGFLHIPAGIISITGMCLILILCKEKTEDMLKNVEWEAILFFIGLFMMIGALEHNGVINIMAEYMLDLCGKNLFGACIIILIGSAVLSSLLDNIPFVIAMTPLVQKLMIQYGSSGTGSHPLIWALVFGACLGGNGTLIGSSANIIVTKISVRNGYPITFGKFFLYGFPFMIQSLIIAIIYMWIRYFLF